MPHSIFADTGALLAAYNPRDKYYHAAQAFFHSDHRFVTTNFVVDETITLALNRVGHRLAVELGDNLWSGNLAGIVYVTKTDQRLAWDLFKRYDDKMFSFTDCTSFAVMLRLGLTDVFTFDGDFTQSGLFTKVP
jgi:predicted nucleic acid-binding protein